IGTRGGWGAKAVLQACRKVVERPNSGKPTDRVPGKVVTVDEFRTSRPCEEELDSSKPTRPEGWKPKPGQVQDRLLRSAWSKRFEAPVRGIMCKQSKARRNYTMSRTTSILALSVLLASIGLAAAQDVPPECLSSAQSLQSACSAELSKASATLGVSVCYLHSTFTSPLLFSVILLPACSFYLPALVPCYCYLQGGSDPASLGAAAQQAVASGKTGQALAEFNPSSGCCKAACAFAATGCLCKQSVVDLVNSVTRVDAGTSRQLTSAFANKCRFQEISLAAGEGCHCLNPLLLLLRHPMAWPPSHTHLSAPPLTAGWLMSSPCASLRQAACGPACGPAPAAL
ncbi:hypothetical protein QJQ45_014956, partial [Haematococcus lacustris]